MIRNSHVLTMLLTTILPAVAAAQDISSPSEMLRDPMPLNWDLQGEFVQKLPSDDNWWKNFSDPVLDSLIVTGMERNFNLLQATRRREIARLQMRQAQSAYWPAISANAGYTRSKSGGIDGNSWTLGAEISWEIDIFGKIGSQVKAGKATYNASKADYTGIMVSLAAQIAETYVKYRELQSRLIVAREHTQSQAEVLKKVEARFEAGLVSKLDVAQAKTVYYNTETTVPALELALRQTLNALSTLLGEYPDQLTSRLGEFARLPVSGHIIPAGIPADLLRRRPDIVSAEWEVASYAARMGIAKKDFLPTLALKGEIGWTAPRIGDLFKDNSFGYSVSPTLTWTLFSGFSRKYAVEEARQQMQASIDSYNLTVMTAVSEVDNSMAAYRSALETLELATKALQQSRESFDLSMDQYIQGLAAFTNVVNAQIDWLDCSNSVVTARANALIALIDIYKALGGAPHI